MDLFGGTSLPLLLPAVEAGILNDNWRIRQSSVELLGDLLFKVSALAGATPAMHDPGSLHGDVEHAGWLLYSRSSACDDDARHLMVCANSGIVHAKALSGGASGCVSLQSGMESY